MVGVLQSFGKYQQLPKIKSITSQALELPKDLKVTLLAGHHRYHAALQYQPETGPEKQIWLMCLYNPGKQYFWLLDFYAYGFIRAFEK